MMFTLKKKNQKFIIHYTFIFIFKYEGGDKTRNLPKSTPQKPHPKSENGSGEHSHE